MTQAAVYHTETSDMLIPHNMFRRALDTAADVVGPIPPDDTERCDAVRSYFDNVLRFLDAHHGGEDACVWPVLSARCPEAASLIQRMEGEHEAIHRLRGEAGAALDAWRDPDDQRARQQFVDAIARLRTQLEQHFAEEEAEILPLASRNMSEEEWGAMPGHAMATFSGDKLWLILGLVFDQLDSQQRQFVVSILPPPVAEMWNTTGERAYRDFMQRVKPTA